MEQYSKSYSKLLIKSKYCLRGDEENDEEDGPSDRIPPPERQTISFAVDAAPRTQNDWNKYFDTSSYENDDQKRLKNEDTSTASMNMVEARTISYRESMSRLFPNGQDPLNSSLTTAPNSSQMVNFPGLKGNMMNPMFNKTAPEVQPPTNLTQIPRGMMGNNPLHGMNPALANQPLGRGFPNPGARPGQNLAGMDPVSMMKLYGMNQQFNPMNMMNAMGQPQQQRGMQLPPGMNLPPGMSMQAMMQAFQQYQQGGDMGIKAESMEGIENGINVKVQVDDDDENDTNRNIRRAGNKRGDINVKDEESVN